MKKELEINKEIEKINEEIEHTESLLGLADNELIFGIHRSTRASLRERKNTLEWVLLN